MTTIDAHQHFWVYDEPAYGWMTEGMDALRRDHLPADLAPQLDAAGVDATVAVQARRLEVETEWLLALADVHPRIAGVVGWIDIGSPALEATLERWSAHPRLVGLRELIHDMPDPEFATSPAHARAVAAIGRHGLAYDLLLRPAHLPAATRLVDALSDQRFVVDHIAKPDLRRGADRRGANAAWAAGIRRLAERPHVACKLSGLLTEADWDDWRAADVTPYLDTVLEAFGADRCMIGSDWPVCTLAAPYGVTIGLLTDYAAGLSPHERRALLGATARTWYRLEERGA